MSDNETRIADLENEIKHRDRRILELKREVDEAQTLIAEMREQVQDRGFRDDLERQGHYALAPWVAKLESYLDKYNALAAQWNKTIVPPTSTRSGLIAPPMPGPTRVKG